MLTRREFGAASLALLIAPRAIADTGSWPKGDLAKDVTILRQAYETMHPGLYRYNTKAQMDARFDALATAFPASRTIQEAFLALTTFTSAIKCGHTYSSFFNQSKETGAALFSGRDKLPLHFKWRGGRMIVVKDLTADAKVARGTEVLSVNGVPAKTILDTLTPLVRADGSNDAKRRYLLEVKGLESIEAFDVYFPLVFPLKAPEFALTLRAASGAETKTILPAIDLAARQASRASKQPTVKDDPKDWSLAHGDGVAILKMDDWVTYNTKWDWRGFLDTSFADIAARKSKALIVDLRGNEGGEDCGDEIIARLIDKDLPQVAADGLLRFRKAPENLWPYLDTWDNSFRTLGDGAEDLGNGFYRQKAEGGVAAIKPKGPRFSGKVAVLTDAGNSSATFQFASTIKRAKLGELIGETTGGNRRGINGGAFFFLQLPGSALEAELPLIGYFPKGEQQPDAGLEPDIAVAETAEDIAAGRDRVMETALARLRG